MGGNRRRLDLGVALALVGATLAVYGQTRDFGFILSDDTKYVVANPWVNAGLTPAGFTWAFTTSHGSNWHPLTWLSLMLDAELFGSGPAGFHTTNVLLHILGVLLFYGLLRRTTGRVWPAAFAAALFALHPIHVESVAWVPERKDVLSGCFGLLALHAYAAYAYRGGVARYLAVALLLSAGLMSKQTLVTLPLLLLLLDRWPLGRLRAAASRRQPGVRVDPAPARSLGWLALEKLPLLALCAAASSITLQVQEGAMGPARPVLLPLRLANAAVSYVRYLGKLVWPDELAFLYPHPDLPGGTPWAAWEVAAAALLLVAITALVWRAKRRPYLAVGWLWFLIALLPMIGVVQVGFQAMADRYAYLALLGPYFAIAWLGAERIERLRLPTARAIVFALALCVLVLLGVRAGQQAALWRDTETLFEHARSVAPRSPFVLSGLAGARRSHGRIADAAVLYRESLAIWAENPAAHANLGVALASLGDADGAIAEFREAVRHGPGEVYAHLNLAKLLHARGEIDEAVAHYQSAVELGPGRIEARLLLAKGLRSQGLDEEAAEQLDLAIEVGRNRIEGGIDSSRARTELAQLLWERGLWDDALAAHHEAVRLGPADPKALTGLARALIVHPELGSRDPARAIELASQAVSLSQSSAFDSLIVLAQAYAAAERFDDAISAGLVARQRADAAGIPTLVQWIGDRVAGWQTARQAHESDAIE